MGEPSLGIPPSVRPPQDRLDSWKEIAAYLNRDVTTVQRWEKREGMPVHRHLHDRAGSVYAFCSELDAWVRSRKVRLEKEEDEPRAKAPVEVPVDAEGDHRPRVTPRMRPWFILGGVAVVALLAGTNVLIRGRSRQATPAKIKSLAVLPLKNLSGDPGQEYLADGMTEALIGRLSRIHDLRVISRTSVMRFKDTKLSVPEIARTLGVDAMVEGSVIREGSRIRVNAQLIRAATDDHFWSEAYDREMGDTLQLESDVAQSIARRVEVTVSGEEHARVAAARHVSPEVYDSYLKGESELANSNSRPGFEKSIAYFEEAIRKDETFAPAYVGLASVYEMLGTSLVGAAPDETRPKLISAARKALELDPGLAKPHTLLAGVYEKQWQWSNAEAEYKQALELDPNDAGAHVGFARWLLCQGRMDEALEWSQRARELDPLGVPGGMTGWILFHARRYEQAIREMRSALAIDPDLPGANWFLGFALIANSQPDEAIAVLEKAVSLTHRSPAVIGVLIRAYAHAGRRIDALRLLDELKRRQEKSYVPSAAFVNAYLGLGENEQALAWLDKAYQEQSNIMGLIKVHPYFDPLRGDPRFKELVHRVGLD
jgi:TolB-like protein/Tfp pilus assembly protein PilF